MSLLRELWMYTTILVSVIVSLTISALLVGLLISLFVRAARFGFNLVGG